MRSFSRFSASILRFTCFILCFGLIIFTIPVVPGTGKGRTTKIGRAQLPQGPPIPNPLDMPNLDELRQIDPGPPRVPAPVPATVCRHRDQRCKQAKGEISSHQPPADDGGLDRLLARLTYPSWLDHSAKRGPYLFDLIDPASRHDDRVDSYSLGMRAGSPVAAGPLPSMQSTWPMALLDPKNRVGSPGEDILSRNYNWSLPLVNLSGRAGLDLNLTLSLNSLLWIKDGGTMLFDLDEGFPRPAFGWDSRRFSRRLPIPRLALHPIS